MSIVRLAKPEDAEAVINVQYETWLATYPSREKNITAADIKRRLDRRNKNQRIADWSKTIKDRKTRVWVAADDDEVVGFCVATHEESRNRIGAIYVLPKFQSNGIGSELLTAAVEWLGEEKPIYLEVADYNQAAINFYSHHGFKLGKEVEDKTAATNSVVKIPQVEMIKEIS